MQNAEAVMQQLDKQERKLVEVRLGQTKQIKCMFCGHKGQSFMEETTSVITYLVFAILILGTWDWIIASTWIYPIVLIFFVLPVIAGFFRIQTHSCRECLNEVK